MPEDNQISKTPEDSTEKMARPESEADLLRADLRKASAEAQAYLDRKKAKSDGPTKT